LFPAEPLSPEEPNSAAFRQALQNLGYLEGQTVAMEYRYALGRIDRFLSWWPSWSGSRWTSWLSGPPPQLWLRRMPPRQFDRVYRRI
jgi:hypothetical protein